MARIFKNKTGNDVDIVYGNTTLPIPSNSQIDLLQTFQSWELASSETLINFLAQGTDKYQLNDGINDLTSSEAIDLIKGYCIKYPLSTTGVPVISTSISDALGLYRKCKMYKFDVTAGNTCIFDIEVTTERIIVGGEYWIRQSDVNKIHEDDTVDFKVVDKNDVLELFTPYGLSVANGDILQLPTIVEDDYIQKGDPDCGYYSDMYKGLVGSFKVKAGLFNRIIINSYGTENFQLRVRFFYYE